MSNFARYRKLFKVTDKYIYLNHASTGPLPLTAVKAISDLATRYSEQGTIDWSEYEAMSNSTRALAARLVGASPDEICFVQNTSQGIIYAIGSIPWQKGDNVILMKGAFPTNFSPFLYLLPEIEKRYVTSVELKTDPSCLVRLIDQHTKAVSLDWVNFLNGIRLDLKTISRICQKHNVYFIVDAMQGCGAVKIDLQNIQLDFFCSAAPKWLLGPHGIGIFYINKNILGELKPFNLGWLSADWDDFYDVLTPREVKTSAARFEEGTKNYLGIAGFKAALELFLEIGTEKVEEQVLDLGDYLLSKINTPGFEIITPLDRTKRAGIISFRKKSADTMELFKKLKENNIICSFRENYLRVSPHFYNTTKELDKLVELL
jgi:cysteine desulfurase/selenocysteine lyase